MGSSANVAGSKDLSAQTVDVDTTGLNQVSGINANAAL